MRIITDSNPETLPTCFLKVEPVNTADTVFSLTVVSQIATVRGVDLFPPPVPWLPPNCFLEVDDVVQPWTWRDPFDLVHLRLLDAAFTPQETDQLYQQCYE